MGFVLDIGHQKYSGQGGSVCDFSVKGLIVAVISRAAQNPGWWKPALSLRWGTAPSFTVKEES